MRILVTGSRNWFDEWAVAKALDDAVTEPRALVIVVHGGCPNGADRLADEYARERGWVIEEHSANWKAYGSTAGFIRNQEMVDTKPNICLAFIKPCQKSRCKKPQPHDSHGAADCVERAKAACIAVEEYR